jgi:hypothetical protein
MKKKHITYALVILHFLIYLKCYYDSRTIYPFDDWHFFFAELAFVWNIIYFAAAISYIRDKERNYFQLILLIILLGTNFNSFYIYYF